MTVLQQGAKLGPYEVLEPLGSGGMGEVWKARDTRLHRLVAIKRLTTVHADRFQHEARAIAALNHPHICQIHDIGPDYLVLEFVDGKPLAGPLPTGEMLRVAIQVASALEAAHARGLLHRDIKPGNIIVSSNGSAKLLDFGLARPVGSDSDVTLTRAEAVAGTPAYMSPEQVEGRPLDARTDIFSFGALLYEMVSGVRAFEGTSTIGVLTAVLHDEPPPLTPSVIERLVRRCLRKDPRDRFQTMSDVKEALERAGRESSTEPCVSRLSIAVLPFANMSADAENEYFSDGLAEEIMSALAQIEGLKVIARTSAFAFKGKHEDVRRIAAALGVAHVLEGSVRKAGSRIRVTAQLVTAADGSHLWSERYDRELADVFAIQDEIAQAIAAALKVTLAIKPSTIRYRPKLPAYDAFLKGRQHMLINSPVAFEQAVEYFEQAISVDPEYAAPHASLGLTYFLSTMSSARSPREMMRLIRAEAKEALSLSSSDVSAHFLVGSVAAAYEYKWASALESFAMAQVSSSALPEAHWAYASLYLQPLGRFDEAVVEMERAVDLDPLNAFWRGVLVSHLTHAERFDDAIRQGDEALAIDGMHSVPLYTMGEAYATMGRWQEAVRFLERAHELVPSDGLMAGTLAGALVRAGARDRAESVIRRMGETPRPLMGRVLYHWLCSEEHDAAVWYERAINGRDPFAIVFAGCRLNREFRNSSHWPKLARMMNMP